MKRCPFCAEEIQDAAIKCRHCGSMLNEVAKAPAASAPGPNDGGRVIYTGTPSWKGWYGTYAAVAALAVVGVAGASALATLTTIPGAVAALVGAALVVAALAVLVTVELRRRSTQYRVSTRTIDIEEGVLARRINTLQLWRVRDVMFEQSLTQRMLGVADIRLVAHDDTTPAVTLGAVTDGRAVFEEVKLAIDLARQARNVVGLVE